MNVRVKGIALHNETNRLLESKGRRWIACSTSSSSLACAENDTGSLTCSEEQGKLIDVEFFGP